MRFYISGKIGEEKPSRDTLAKFKKAEDMLKSNGHDVFNPTNSGLGAHAESLAMKNGTTFWEEIVILDIAELKKCDAIYLLDDWVISDGAQSEYYYAKGAGKEIIFQNPWHATLYLEDILRESRIAGHPLMVPDEGESVSDCQKRFVRKHIGEVWIPL